MIKTANGTIYEYNSIKDKHERDKENSTTR